MKPILLLFVISTFFACQQAPKQVVATPEDDTKLIEKAISDINPKDQALIFRRTTLIVRDIDKSLALYGDAMGMEIIYDQVIKRAHPFKEGKQQSVRLIFLKALDKFQGVLGLVDYHYGEKDKEIIPIRKEGFVPQNVVLLFNSNDLDARFEKIKMVPDVDIISAPKLTQYPAYNGKDTIKVMVSKFYDPDGFIVEFNKLLSDL